MDVKTAKEITGGLSKTTKMPGGSYSLPAGCCGTGSLLCGIKGSVCEGCYARKGRYRMPNVVNAMDERREGLSREEWSDAMVSLISRQKCPYFRWHDSGDLQGTWHMKKIIEVSERLKGYKFFLPTKEYTVVSEVLENMELPSNMVIRLGAPMVNVPFEESGISDVLLSMVVTPDKMDLAEKAGAHLCPATANPDQKTCGRCRMCWNEKCGSIAYVKH